MIHPLKIDFEFASTLDLKKVGIYRITEHPTTFIRCYAVKWGDRRGYFLDPDKPPSWLIKALEDDSVPIHAHNATVERLLIERIAGPRHGWPVPHRRRWRCSAARARRLALPGALKGLGAALGLGEELSKDRRGALLITQLSKPKRTPDGFVFNHDPAKLDEFGRYCLQDVIAEDAAEEHPAMLPMPEQEQRYWTLTERINDRGVRIDTRLVKRLIHRANEATEELNSRIRALTGGAVTALTNVAQIKGWLWDEFGVELATLRKEDMDGLLKEAQDAGLPERAKDVLRIRQAGAKSSVSKLIAILDRISRDGRLHGAFVYHGASTGRYTSMGVQLQNLVRDVLKDFDKAIRDLDRFTLEQISQALRGCFIPREGHVFVDADYSAIEARGVGWLAGCTKLLAIYRANGDPYCEMGTVIYGFRVTKENEWERFVGKQTILGCGYGMGAAKFEAQCIKFGKPVGAETAEKAVKAYRTEFPEIPQLWRDMEDAAVSAVQSPGETFQIPNGLIKFRVVGHYLQMALPSGRRLFYKDPYIRYEDKFNSGRKSPVLWFWGINPKTKQWTREKTWGGTLTENAVQAISRDLLFGAMERLEDEFGVPIVLSVHDQIVGEVLEEDGEWAVRQVERAMTELPPWARGFPVEAKPKIMQRFGK